MSERGWVWSDGGREAAGFSVNNDAGDCVVRSIAIAGQLGYRTVYEQISDIAASHGKPRSARDGVTRKVYDQWFTENGWEWTPTMTIGSGCQVHLRPDELPSGRIIARLSKHLVAVVDGVAFDTHDCTRDGTRCVYGYWKKDDE